MWNRRRWHSELADYMVDRGSMRAASLECQPDHEICPPVSLSDRCQACKAIGAEERDLVLAAKIDRCLGLPG
jgi:hypothetical protein